MTQETEPTSTDEPDRIYSELATEQGTPAEAWDMSPAPEFADDLINATYPGRHRADEQSSPSETDSQ